MKFGTIQMKPHLQSHFGTKLKTNYKNYKIMIKLYYKTTGEEPDVNCIEPCKYDCRPSEGTMIGSCFCKECSYCYGWDMEECWVKCLKHAMENAKK